MNFIGKRAGTRLDTNFSTKSYDFMTKSSKFHVKEARTVVSVKIVVYIIVSVEYHRNCTLNKGESSDYSTNTTK